LITGIWYIVFLSQLLLYHDLNEAFGIEPPQDTPKEKAE